MKRSAIAVFVGLLLGSFVWAQTASVTSSVNVIVKDVFLTSIADGGSLEFKNLVPGNEDTKTVNVSVTTNLGRPWTLKLQAFPVNGSPQLPAGTIRYNASGTPSPLLTSMTTIYSSVPGEESVTGKIVPVDILINLPSAVAAGNYGTILNFSLVSN